MQTKKKPALQWAHPIIREWFTQHLGAPTEPQQQGWVPILAGKPTLISAPTGSGKTLAAFMVCIDKLVREAVEGRLEDQIQVVYVSPLKALSNDVQKNLLLPLQAVANKAKETGVTMDEIRVAIRTGDTLAKERQAMLRKPPHILVTTPESLYILLTAEKSRALLTNVKTVIVDEIHALANNKRGAHLTLSLERLDALTKKRPLRIGLSATQKPLELVANFLIGNRQSKPTIVNIGHKREMELSLEVPKQELGPVASNEMWDEIYDRLSELAKENRSTLIFVNTRRLAERVAHHLSERLGEKQVAAHHGSLSRKIRLAVETKLKQGELKVLVATASLELGIDIGTIDLACQIGTSRAIAIALQRVGRAGHWYGAISKGKFFATTRDELVECAALILAIKKGDLDALIMPEQPMDILAQQIVAACSAHEWKEEDLFKLVKKAYPYQKLTREEFDELITMLSDGIAGTRGRYGVYLFHDQVNHRIKARRKSRLTAITSGGAIPETGLFTVIAEPTNTMVGTLDEDFAIESNRGDIILLGTTSWNIKRVESKVGRVIVEDAHGAPPSVPFWFGEAPARTKELSDYVAQLRQEIGDRLNDEELLQWLIQHCGVDQSGASQLIEYISQGKAVLGAIPTKKVIIAERFFDEGGGMQLIIHAPFGARINKAWGLALRKRFCRSFNFELQAAATDNGINIALAEQHSFPLADVFQFLHPNTIKEVLVQAVLQAPLFATRWRWTATRSLALERFRYGRKTPPNILRMLSDDLLAAVFPDAAACQDNLGGQDIKLPDHPLINEAMKEVLHDALDIDGLIEVLSEIKAGNITCIAVDTPLPSTFSHEILNANPYAFLDDAPLEERRARAVEMRRMLPQSVLEEVGKLDRNVIQEVQKQAWPDVRDIDEMHDVLQTFIALPVNLDLNEHQVIPIEWQGFLNELQLAGRVCLATLDEKPAFWVSVEKAKTFQAIYPKANLSNNLPDIEKNQPEQDDAMVTMIRGWMLYLGPTNSLVLSKNLQIDLPQIDQALLKLESTGLILRGHFHTTEMIEWCERRLLARIHRLTVERLREEIKPVTAQQFATWLLTWQHLTPGSQLTGELGLLEIISQLQGFELPANSWEHRIFNKRMTNYTHDLLDRLCLSGVVRWGRLSPFAKIASEQNDKRIVPMSNSSITFFLREKSDWLPTLIDKIVHENSLSHIAKMIYHYLQQKGASFFTDIVHGVGHLKSEVEKGLWELVVSGFVTADSYDNLRGIIDPRRRLDKRRYYGAFRFNTGRWSILEVHGQSDPVKQIEAACWMLLKRYGIVFRDLLQREKNIPNWRDLLFAFRRLEDRGEIRGGRFVAGFHGEQFALPYAAESLRAAKKENAKSKNISVSAADPLNLIGIILPGKRVSGKSKQSVQVSNES